MQSPNTNKNNIKPTNNNPSRKPSAAASQPRCHASTTQACAACKYQRRKCASDCILAPYFPHDRHQQFLNAHRLFGVSNIVKIVAALKQPEKDHAMRTIMFQSDARAADPVGGCHRLIRDLENQISLAKAELEIVLHHLSLCQAAAAAAQQAEAATDDAVPPPPECGDSYDERWREQYAAAAAEDLNSWECLHAESTSSSLPRDYERKCSLQECNDLIGPIFDHLVCDDARKEEEFEFDSHGNIIRRNIKAAVKEDEECCLSYVEDHHDLKAAATFFSLTNCDL